MLVANLQACQEFLRKYQPAFSGTFTLYEFRHVNPLKRVSISRTVTARSMITNGSVSLIDLHIKLGGESDAHAGVLGIEEALDLSLLCPYYLVGDSRSHLNMYSVLSA